MHSFTVLVWCLRVNELKREWFQDLPEMTSIRFCDGAFSFKNDELSELIMRSGDNEMNWWIDLPKLTTLTTVEESRSFELPRIITLEGTSHHSIFTNRHALSHYCHSWQGMGFLQEEFRHCKESLFLLSLIPRYHSNPPILSPVHCFFHMPLSSQHQIAVFTLHNNYFFPSSLLFFLRHSMSCYQAFLHDNSLLFIVFPEINPSTPCASSHNHYWLYCNVEPDSLWQNTRLLVSWVFHS